MGSTLWAIPQGRLVRIQFKESKGEKTHHREDVKKIPGCSLARSKLYKDLKSEIQNQAYAKNRKYTVLGELCNNHQAHTTFNAYCECYNRHKIQLKESMKMKEHSKQQL